MNFVDIEKEVRPLESNKSTISGSILPKILKENSDICCKPLTNVMNNGIANSRFDSDLKLADLTPVHKGGDTTNIKNYRKFTSYSF